MSNTEYRAVIKLFTRKDLRATEITKELVDIYDDSAASQCTVAKWVAQFSDPTRVFEYTSRSERPTTTLIDESIRAVEVAMIRMIDKLLFDA